MTNEEPLKTRKKRGRSPGYPAIDLKEALERVKELKNKEGRNEAPVEVILRHWGYKEGTSTGRLVFASLKKYGLLEPKGSGKAQLSDLAIKITQDKRPDSSERDRLIKEAAIRPTIFRELLKKYPDGIPSDDTISFYLTTERTFTDSAAAQVIKTFKKTLAYAKINETDLFSGYEGDKTNDESEDVIALIQPETTSAAPRERQALGQSGPELLKFAFLGGRATLSMTTEEPLSEDGWNSMMAVLEAMKPGLVTEKRDSDSGSEANKREEDNYPED